MTFLGRGSGSTHPGWRTRRALSYLRCVISEHDQAARDRLRDEVRARARVQLLHRVADVRANGVVRDVQLVADLAGRVTERDEPHDLALARGQLEIRLVEPRFAAEATAPARRPQAHEQHEP